MPYPVSRRFYAPVAVALLFLSSLPRVIAEAPSRPAERSAASAAPEAIVVGFVGGFVGRHNAAHCEVQLAQRLSSGSHSPFQVRMFENRCGREAHAEILRLLDTDKNGRLSEIEKRQARIAIYGHSWGASEAVNVARMLARDKVPVLLTVQVDSVQKLGEDDAWIPENVTQAVNYYQLDGLLHGRPQIRAVDASRTEILGNYLFNYKTKSVSCDGYPWYARLFMKPHVEIESDPAVWGQVESLIRVKLLSGARAD